MSKYAIITPCTIRYLPGLNANLNALDYYGNDIDVFVIDGGDLPKDYIEEIKTAFSFKVEVIPINELKKKLAFPIKSLRHALITTPYQLMLDLEDKYDVVSLMGADICVVNNIMRWYEIADKLDYIITAHNSFSLAEATDLQEKWIVDGNRSSVMTVADTPAILNIHTHRDLIEKTLELVNKCGGNMKCFNGAIWHTKKMDKVLELPGDLWTCGIYYLFMTQLSKNKDGKITYWANRERISMIHRRWWTKSVREYAYRGQTPESQLYNFAFNNANLWEGIYRKFNLTGKVKIDYFKFYEPDTKKN